MAKAQIDETLTRFVGHLVRWLVILLAVLACLGVFGVQTTSFAAVIGAAGLAVGLAFQGTLSNFAAGVMLLVFRPFSVGDVVNAAGVLGKVQAIELFTVAIDTFDNRRIIIPNSSVFGSTIENVSYHPIRRADVDVGTDYTADIDQTRELLLAAAKSVEGGLEDPAPDVFLAGLGASSVDWSVTGFATTGASLTGVTVSVKTSSTVALRGSVAVTRTSMEPTSGSSGVPEKVPVIASKLSHVGSGSPFASVAESVSSG
jgi:small conductance mechanosensitive channel